MATHPTEIIKDEIKARGMTKKEFAERMGMRQSNISRLLKGEDITVSMASKLEMALGIAADFWLTMQTNYDKDVKAIEKRDTLERSASNTEHALATFLNLPLLYKRLGIHTEVFINKRLQILEDALGFNPIDLGTKQLVNQFSFKESDKLDIDDINRNTWLAIAYIKAKNAVLPVPFIIGNAYKAAKEIADMSKDTGIKENDIKVCLNNYGIVYEVVPKLPHVPIDAVAVNSGARPAVIVTHRHDDMAMLIFNIMHELGHIELHMYKYGNEMFVSSDRDYSSSDAKESEANSFAEDMLIDKCTWKKIMSASVNSLWGYKIVESLRKSSKAFHLNEHIVIWRYKHENDKYHLNGVSQYHIV